MTPHEDRTTVLRLGVAAADCPGVVARLGLRPDRATVRRLLLLEASAGLAGGPCPLLDVGITVQAEVGAAARVVTLRHRGSVLANAPPVSAWRVRHEWAPHMREARPVHVARAVLPAGPVTSGMDAVWSQPGRRWVELTAVAERMWHVAVRDLDLTVLRWTVEGVRARELVQIEHPVAPSEAPFVLPVLRAVGIRLGVDPALVVEPLDIRAVLSLATTAPLW